MTFDLIQLTYKIPNYGLFQCFQFRAAINKTVRFQSQPKVHMSSIHQPPTSLKQSKLLSQIYRILISTDKSMAAHI